MDQAWADVVVYYRKHHTPMQYGSAAPSSFIIKYPYPKLEGKVDEVKDIMPALLTAWQTCMDTQEAHRNLINVMLPKPCSVQSILHD